MLLTYVLEIKSLKTKIYPQDKLTLTDYIILKVKKNSKFETSNLKTKILAETCLEFYVMVMEN